MDEEEHRRKRRRLHSNATSPTRGSAHVIDLTRDSPEPQPEPNERPHVTPLTPRKAVDATGSPLEPDNMPSYLGSSSMRNIVSSALLRPGKRFKQEPASSSSEMPLSDDAAYARQLQAQFDLEHSQIVSNPQGDTYGISALSAQTPASLQSSNLPPPRDIKRVPRSESPLLDDAALARQLQEQFDQETARAAPTPDGRPDSSFDRTSEPSLAAKAVQTTVRDFAKPLSWLKCVKCKRFPFKEADIDSMARIPGRELKCASCNTNLQYTGADLRIVKIWVLLCSFDSKSKHNKPYKKGKQPLKPSRSNQAGGSGGTGYGGGHHLSKASYRAAPGIPLGKAPTLGLASIKPLNEDDAMTAQVMSRLAELLPSFEREDPFDFDPPTTQLRSLLLCSSILERAADLLRNNDLEDVTNRVVLYTSLTEFVQALAAHPSTSLLTFGERAIRSPGASILQISLGKAELIDSEDTDTTQPLIQCIQELASQADWMLKRQYTDPGDKLLFQSIRDLNDFLLANAGSAKESTEKGSWHHDLAVSDVPDEYILDCHSLMSKATSGSRQPGQMKRIMQEIARLKTSLPEGIFVCHCETRPDVMKILIIGPKDTPYENGLFEFDLLCDASFPQGPPKMNFRTTGGGKVHFNPNLYQCGKICLSLLGTWSGEPWDPKGSTLLQVLVSIQAMILCENPWQNEPGREKKSDAALQNKKYNRSLYPHTVRTAMLDWLENSIDNTDSIWSEIVRRHFDDNAQDIITTVRRWAAESNQYATVGPYDHNSAYAGAGQVLGGVPTYLSSYVPVGTAYPSAQGSGTGWQGQSLNGTTAQVTGRDLVPILREAVAKLKKNAYKGAY